MPNADKLLRAARNLHRAGRIAEAEAAYRHALASDATNADALHGLGVLNYQTGRFEQALVLMRRSLASNPGAPEFHSNVAAVLGALGRHEEATAALREALHLRPDHADARSNLGVLLESRGRLHEAIAEYREAIRLRPDYREAHHNLGNVLRKLGRLPESAAAYREALRLDQGYANAYQGLAFALMEQGLPDEAIACYRELVALRPNSASIHSDLLFAMLHHGNLSAQEVFDEHLAWAARHAEPLSAAAPPHINDHDPNRPLRVGYVSPDFREHPTARFIEPVLAAHDRRRYTPICYSDVSHPDAITHHLRALAAEWRDTSGMSEEAVAATIRNDRVDILVDLNGHMGGNRLPIFARRPAPVQATYLYPHSTGMAAMDYRITDATCDPPEFGTQRCHTEALVRLEGCCWCYHPTDDSPGVTGLPAARNGFITFGSLNRVAKLTPEVAALWANVLAAVPGSRLLILAPGGEGNTSLRGRFERAGIAPERVALLGPRPRPAYLELAREIDIALDPFPYNGTTTTCDLLWMGVPVITLAETSAVSRVGLDLLAAVGLSDLVARTPPEYVSIGAALARDFGRLEELRSGLRDRMSLSALTDARRFTINLESAYREMWRRWCDSRVT